MTECLSEFEKMRNEEFYDFTSEDGCRQSLPSCPQVMNIRTAN